MKYAKEKQYSGEKTLRERINLLIRAKLKIPEENHQNLLGDEFENAAVKLSGDKKEERIQQSLNAIPKVNEQQQEMRKEIKNKLEGAISVLKIENEILEADTILYQEVVKSEATATLRNTPYPGVKNYTLYAMARLGMLPLADVEQLNSEFGPVINDFLSFRYRLSTLPCQKVKARRSIFIAVISAPANFDKRNMIRKTWRNYLKAVEQEDLMGLAGFAFILGLTENNFTQSVINEESNTFGDIIQIEMMDFYRNLSMKVAGLLNWLYKNNCRKVDYVLKVDDDVYVNVPGLAHFVQSKHPFSFSIFGSSVGPFGPARGNFDF